jgi:hypothetical protein
VSSSCCRRKTVRAVCSIVLGWLITPPGLGNTVDPLQRLNRHAHPQNLQEMHARFITLQTPEHDGDAS